MFGCVNCLSFGAIVKLLRMAAEDDKKKMQESTDEDDIKAPTIKGAEIIAVEEQVGPQHCGSSTDEPPAKASPRKRKQAGSVDLSAASSSNPPASKNRQTIKELQAEKIESRKSTMKQIEKSALKPSAKKG